MDPQLHFLTVVTADLDAARRFYVDGLGWTPVVDVPEEIVFFQVAPGLLLAFFDAAKAAADTGSRETPAGFTLSHNVATAADVDTTVAALAAAGGTVVKPVADSAFGGVRHGLVRDPNGVLWEVGHNPRWRIRGDGSVELGVPDRPASAPSGPSVASVG